MDDESRLFELKIYEIVILMLSLLLLLSSTWFLMKSGFDSLRLISLFALVWFVINYIIMRFTKDPNKKGILMCKNIMNLILFIAANTASMKEMTRCMCGYTRHRTLPTIIYIILVYLHYSKNIKKYILKHVNDFKKVNKRYLSFWLKFVGIHILIAFLLVSPDRHNLIKSEFRVFLENNPITFFLLYF